MRFGQLVPASCSDWPGEVTAVLFTVGCNMRCSFCSNFDLFHESDDDFDEKEALNKLRTLPIDHVVLCGGEPTIQTGLVEFCRELKAIGWHVKLDTNGTLPDIIEACLPYLDAIAVDIKTDPEHYESLTGMLLPWEKLMKVLVQTTVPVEYRTTLVALPEITPETVATLNTMIPKEASRTYHTRIIKQGYAGDMYGWSKQNLETLSL